LVSIQWADRRKTCQLVLVKPERSKEKAAKSQVMLGKSGNKVDDNGEKVEGVKSPNNTENRDNAKRGSERIKKAKGKLGGLLRLRGSDKGLKNTRSERVC